MKNIKKFDAFIKESKVLFNLPAVNIPESVIFFIQEIAGKNHLSKFFGDKNLKDISLDKSNQDEIGNRIVVNWKDFFFHIPFVEYNPETNKTYLTEEFNYDAEETLENLKEKFGLDIPTWGIDFSKEIASSQKTSIIYQIISGLLATSRKEKDFLNIFETDFRNTPEFKFLEKIGTEIVSAPLQVKRGVLLLQNPKYPNKIAVYPNGYLRSFGGRTQMLTSDSEFNLPIYTLDDLRKKLSYIINFLIKNDFKKLGIPSNEISVLLKAIGGQQSAGYSEIARELVKKYPELVLILPEPDGGFDPDLKSGAKLLKRFGAFGS
jgi:hypothetical protein